MIENNYVVRLKLIRVVFYNFVKTVIHVDIEKVYYSYNGFIDYYKNKYYFTIFCIPISTIFILNKKDGQVGTHYAVH